MKKLTLLLLFQWVFFAFSQNKTDWKNVTFKDAAFFGALNTKENVVQKDKTGDLTRILTPFEKNSPDEYFRYLLNCYNKEGIVEESQYIFSKIGIPKDFDLFRIKCNSAEVLCYDYFANKEFKFEKNIGVKMTVKVHNEEVGLNNPMANYAQSCGNGGISICEDWYLVEYYVESGEIISISFWETTCSGCIGGGGGGGGNTTPPDPAACSNDQGNPVSILEGISYSGGPDIRNSDHPWTFFQGNGWRIKSFEKGTQKLTAIGEWRYTALDHISTNLTGTSLDYELTHTLNSAVGTPDGGGEYARMTLHYTINYICKRTGDSFDLQPYSSAGWRTDGSQAWIFGPALE